ncbi:MAG: threonylcarbamoyl-AMP synthase [Candidatus Wildermuthbacteria bacterium]|nr:threonylcarbamoyl-AMP synthase [Candidatus Wildermuthbacteria bacterium]
MKVIPFHKCAPDFAAHELKKGRVFAMPTDTVYGFVGDVSNPEVVGKIFQIKGRDAQKPLGVFAKDIEQAKEIAHISKAQEASLKKAWPGKYTAILSCARKFPEGVGTGATIGIRVPNHRLLLDVLEQLGKPLVQTSANISGRPVLMSARDVVQQFQGRKFQPDYIIDAGTLPESLPSAVVDMTGKRKKIVRKGV